MTVPPPDDRISAYLDGELSAAEHFEVQQLLVTSAEWRAELDAVAWARVSVRAMPAYLAPRGWWDELRRNGPQEARPEPKASRRERRRQDDEWPLAQPVSPGTRDLDFLEPGSDADAPDVEELEHRSERPSSVAPTATRRPAMPASPLPVAPPPRGRHAPDPLGPVTVPPTPLELPKRLPSPEQVAAEAASAAPPAEAPPAEALPEDPPPAAPPEPVSPGALTHRVRRPPTRSQPFPVEPAPAPADAGASAAAPTPTAVPKAAPPERVPVPRRPPTRPTPLRPREYPPRRVSRSAKWLVAAGAAVVVALIAVVLPSRGSVAPRLPEVADSHSVRSSVSDDPVTQLATLSSVANFRR